MRSTPDLKKRGRFASYTFALICTFILFGMNWERSNDHGWQPRQEPPLMPNLIVLFLTASSLGVSIDSEAIAKLLGLDRIGKRIDNDKG